MKRNRSAVLPGTSNKAAAAVATTAIGITMRRRPPRRVHLPTANRQPTNPSAAPIHAARVNDSTSPIAEIQAVHFASLSSLAAEPSRGSAATRTTDTTSIAPVKLPKMFGSSIVPYAPYACVNRSAAAWLTSAPPKSKPSDADTNATTPIALPMMPAHKMRRRNAASASRVSRKLTTRT